jgi:hypothetical protein
VTVLERPPEMKKNESKSECNNLLGLTQQRVQFSSCLSKRYGPVRLCRMGLSARKYKKAQSHWRKRRWIPHLAC